MEIDNYQFCDLLRMEPVPTMPEEDLMYSEVAIMSGGRDQSGRPLVTFPAQNHGILESRVKASGLDRILRYYIDVSSPTTKVHGFAFLADLRFSNLDFISLLKSSLNSLQAETTSVVGPFVLYLIQPLDKRSLKDTQTLLALRQSKKKKNKHLSTPLFQVTIVKDEMDLYNHVDKSQLTADLGGYLQYSHAAWIRFRKTVEPFFIRYVELIPKLPDAFARLEEQESFDLRETREELESQRENIKQLIQEVFREISIDNISQQCDDLLAKINQSDADETFAAVAQKPVFREVRLLAEYCREKLTMAQQRLDVAVERVEGRFADKLEDLDFVDEVNEMRVWLTRDGPAALKKLEIADSLGRAETLCNHFETGVASMAEDKLSLAQNLQDRARAMTVNTNGSIASLRCGVRDLQGLMDDFRDQLDDRRQLLSAVRNYYSLYEKIAKWCVKGLKFLPHDASEMFDDFRADRLGRRGHRDAAGADGEEELQWAEEVGAFLQRNRPPREEDLTSLSEFAETIDDRVKKKKAKNLCHRCSVLLGILDMDELPSNKEVLQAIKWKTAVVGRHSDGSQEENRRGRGRRHRGDGSRKRREGDGVEESGPEEQKQVEGGSDIDDPLLKRIGCRTPVTEVDVKGDRSHSHSSKNRSSKTEDSSRDKVEKQQKRSGDSEKAKGREEEGKEEEEVVMKEEKAEGATERRGTGDQWLRPSRDFWSGRVPGVVRSTDGHHSGEDYGDGVSEDRNEMILNMLAHPEAPRAPYQYLHMNQNANSSPGFVSQSMDPRIGHMHVNPTVGQATLHTQYASPHASQPPVGGALHGQSLHVPPGIDGSTFNVPLGNQAWGHHAQSVNPAGDPRTAYQISSQPGTGVSGLPGHSYTLFDPLTGQPYQVHIQALQSPAPAVPRTHEYLPDTPRSNQGSYPQGQVRSDAYGLQALHALVGQPHGVTSSQERIHGLHIGLDSQSGRSTPRSEHQRELSPYEDVLGRIGQLRVHARHANSGGRSRQRRQKRSANVRAAKSVPNLSSLLAGVRVGSVEDIGGSDRQSDYYARLSHVDDLTGSEASRHATKKWVSRLRADELHDPEMTSMRSASPSLLEAAGGRRPSRPLTPLEKFELESLTSFLNDSDDDKDDSAPLGNSSIVVGNTSADRSMSHKLPRSGSIDIAADQRELDRIRQDLSGSLPSQSAELNSTLLSSHLGGQGFSNSSNLPNHSSGLGSPHFTSTKHSSASHMASHPTDPSRILNHRERVGPFHSGGAPTSLPSSTSLEGSHLAPMTAKMRDYFGDVAETEDELIRHGLEERLRNVHIDTVNEHSSHDHLSTPNFLAEAMDTLVKLDAVDRQNQQGLPLEARHMLQRNPSLQLSDEGVIIDGASWDDGLEPGSVATTERESVESGVGSRGQGSNL
ncbi:uncharacterized protein [Diadema setosum]|uniref:uncharacterized protein n=1 Tax=Diadema setosum TaxID=31175 RepID=UPI003B3A7CE5